MFDNLFTKENIALFGVATLFLWRIIDFFIRQANKRENDREKLAFEMAKNHYNDSREFPKASLFSYYLFYLDALQNDMRPDYQNYAIMKSFDEQLTAKIARLDDILKKLDEVEEKLSNKHEITIADLWLRHLNWALWWHETKILLKNTFKGKTKFRSLQ